MRVEEFRWAGGWLGIKTSSPDALRLVNADPGEYDITPHKEKRSLNANGYLWQLCDKIAEATFTTKEDIYREAVRSVGIFRDFHLSEDEAKTFCTAWGMLGTGWVTEQLDYARDGETLVIRAYYGSSKYNTKQMSRLIDYIVAEAKDLDIETLTPQELARMKEEWN